MSGVPVSDAPIGVASRAAAWRAVRRVHADGAWSGPAVDAALRRSRLDARDRAFAANLAYSTLRWEGTLDWALSSAVSRPLEQVQPEVLDVLRLGAWQLLYGGVPDAAAVDTSVELARGEVGEHVAGFVNGALRGLTRRRDRLPWPPADDDRGLGLRTGYPSWIVREAGDRFGSRAQAVLEAGNEPPGVTLRATGDRDALVEELRAAGLAAEPGRWSPAAVRVPGADPAALPSVAEGRAVVQDESSILVAAAAAHGQRQAGWRALDVCAAPGGKTTSLAQLGGRVVAADLRPGRARQVAAAARTTSLRDAGEVLGVVAADGTRPPWRDEAFDIVLLDAPCSGLGVVRRRPELRWRRGDVDPQRLARLQLALLERSADVVGRAGVLTYSVCTWTRAETADVVAQFLALHGDRYRTEEVATGGAGTRLAGDPGVQLAPDHDGTDGMYICRFRRL